MDYFYDASNPGIPNVRSNIRIPPKMAYAVESSLFALKDFVHVFDFFQYNRNCVHVFDFFQFVIVMPEVITLTNHYFQGTTGI